MLSNFLVFSFFFFSWAESCYKYEKNWFLKNFNVIIELWIDTLIAIEKRRKQSFSPNNKSSFTRIIIILLNSRQKAVLRPCSYMKANISGANKYSSSMFHHEIPFWLLCRKYMLLIRVWVFYDKKMVVALVEKHSKQIFWKLKYFFSTLIVYGIHLELFPKIALTILSTYFFFRWNRFSCFLEKVIFRFLYFR